MPTALVPPPAADSCPLAGGKRMSERKLVQYQANTADSSIVVMVLRAPRAEEQLWCELGELMEVNDNS